MLVAEGQTQDKGPYTRTLFMCVIIGSIGAGWFTVRQRALAAPSPGSCLQLLIIIGMTLFGFIGSIYALFKLVVR
jgi:hypothetical protein